MRNPILFLKGVLLILSLSGCTITLPVSPLTAFPATGTKISNTILLYISPETQQYTLSDGAGIGVFKIPVGSILKESAKNSLQAHFQEVVPTEFLTPGSASTPVLSLQFSEDTWLKAGVTTVAKSAVRISLKAIMHNGAGEEIWSRIINVDAAEDSNIGYISSFLALPAALSEKPVTRAP